MVLRPVVFFGVEKEKTEQEELEKPGTLVQITLKEDGKLRGTNLRVRAF